MGPEKDTKMSKTLRLVVGCVSSLSFKKSLQRHKSGVCEGITNSHTPSPSLPVAHMGHLTPVKITKSLPLWNSYFRVVGADNKRIGKIYKCYREK